MTDRAYCLLYVADPLRSAAFYEGVLGRKPLESSPGFAMFVLAEGTMLGLWARHDVQPAASAAPGGSEVALQVADDATVDGLHEKWSRGGLPIAQRPTTMDFGRTFVALDPDGHRLRVFAPAAR